MPLINTSLPNLIQGVSQQADAVRYDGQCEVQENALSSVSEGLKKRPNTKHIAKLLDAAISTNSFVHFIDRDDDEKFVIIQDETNLRIFNITTGAPAMIDGQYTYPVAGTYLDTPNAPADDLKALTVADNTFLLNTSTVARETTSLTPPYEGKALAFVKQGDYGKTYTINFGKSPESINMTYVIKSKNYDDSDD